MTNYLLDTNILLRAFDIHSVNNKTTNEHVRTLFNRGDQLFITTQSIVEFWAVATRPREANGFGWTTERADRAVDLLLDRFLFLDDNADVFIHWLQLVNENDVSGRRVHDTRLVAVMLAYGITHILTFNVEDFAAYREITVVHPD